MTDRRDDLFLIHVPKTGGTSVRTAMIKAGCRFGPCSAGHDWRPRHETVAEARERIPQFGDLVTFSIVRNPYDRVVSWFHAYKVHTPEVSAQFFSGFSQADRERSVRPFRRCLLSEDFPIYIGGLLTQWECVAYDGVVGVDHLLRHEHIEEDWLQLGGLVGMAAPLPTKRKGVHLAWRMYFTPRIADIVYDWAKEDFVRFGYDRESYRQ